MSLIASLPYIDQEPRSVYVMHEKLERHIPVHQHTKRQLSYVKGGIAYVHIKNKTFVIPARHYFWIPPGLEHVLTVSHSATVLRSIFFMLSIMTGILFTPKWASTRSTNCCCR